MGCQFTVCLPQHDFIFVCTADNQGYEPAGYLIFAALYDHIVAHLEGTSLPADPADGARLAKAVENLSLAHAAGRADSPLAGELNGKTYRCRKTVRASPPFPSTSKGTEPANSATSTRRGKGASLWTGPQSVCQVPSTGYSDRRRRCDGRQIYVRLCLLRRLAGGKKLLLGPDH